MYYSKGWGGGTWVAKSSTPEGPFTEVKMLINQYNIDAQPFTDTDGTTYLYYAGNGAHVGKLNPDMVSFSETKDLVVPNYFEGSFVFKRNGKYYHIYSRGSCADGSYHVRYSTSSTPYGSFTEGSTSPILVTSTDDTVNGPGHNSIITYKGQHYIVYHRHDNPHNSDGLHRQVCIDKMNFNADGSIAKIVPTHIGVGALPLENPLPVETNLAAGKTTTASCSMDEFPVQYACDDNNGTRWAATKGFPQWVEVDLGKNYTVKRCETAFEYVTKSYQYKIEYSTNNSNWSIFADRTNGATGGPLVDSSSGVTARYMKITITGMTSGNYACIHEFKVFGSEN